MDAVHSLYFGPRGPYGTEREAIDAARQRATSGDQINDNLALLTAAATEAGVELGSYDNRVIHWLAGWEPQLCEVVAAIIERAGAHRSNVVE